MNNSREDKQKGFVSLHQHTEYSLLDGMSSVEELPAYAKSLGMESVAITDHGVMFGCVKFAKACKKNGIKPIIGCEVYTAERNKEDKDPSLDRRAGHLILLCKNKTGYLNLIKIVSEAYTKGFYYKPRTDKASIRKYHEGLVCLSGCLAGKIQRLIVEDNYDEAKREALEYREIFGEDFYLELQDHGMPEDKKAIEGLLRLHSETGIELVATNDAHYIRKEDATAHELLLCMQTQSTMNDPDHFRFNAPEYYLKSGEEMRKLFSYCEEACDNTVAVADKCNFEFEFGHYNIPAYEPPEPFRTSEQYFRRLCYEGLKRKYPEVTPELKERLEYEISVISNMGFVEYFLIVWDFIHFAKSRGISVGPGRGSAAGSVVAYCLDITEIEPIKYNLFFERFLNPERVSMPDIDVDFCVRRRAEVIDYVTRKYGKDNVCQISSFITLKPKMAAKDVARVLNIPFAESNQLTKLIPEKMSLTDALSSDPDLRKEYASSPDAKMVLDTAIKLEDIPRNVSTHAAGVVIAPAPLEEFVPLIETKKGVATQYTMTEIEELGLLKMDFLGLRNLTVIQDTLAQIKENHGIDVDIGALDLADPNVYNMLSKGKTVGVFQLESKGITDFMKKLKPSCFEDIIAGVALYRPGPMDSIPDYLLNKKHPEKIEYVDPQLASILDVTYGCIVYQEQVMQIVQKLAGYSFARADLVRRAMSKKKTDVMAQEREYFIHGKLDENGNIEIPGCIRNGVSEQAANIIFDDMESFAQYAFNKSHATAYSVITYQTAWLKCYYPSEFMAALMTSEEDKHDHLAVFIKEAGKTTVTNGTKKIKLLPPDINKSKASFVSDKDGNILYGLAAIKGVGRSLAEEIAGRKYSDLIDVASVPKINSKALESLAYSGALKGITPSVASVLEEGPDILKFVKKNSTKQLSFFMSEPDLFRPKIKNVEELPKEQLLLKEKDCLGTFITDHPLKKWKKDIRTYATISAEAVNESNTGKTGILAGIIFKVQTHFTKKGDKMAFLTIDDIDGGTVEVVVFPRTYTDCKDLLSEGALVAINGKVSDTSFMANEIRDLSHIKALSERLYPSKSATWKELRIRGEEYELQEVEKLMRPYKGKIPVRWFSSGSRLLPVTVSYDQDLLLKLKELLGEENAYYKKEDEC